jgi:hypothetical protein
MCAKSNDNLVHPYFQRKKKEEFHHGLRSTCVHRKKRRQRTKRKKKIIYKSRFSWMIFAHTHTQKKEGNKCLLGMSNSTVDRERKGKREILVCDLHPQHVQTHTHTMCV